MAFRNMKTGNLYPLLFCLTLSAASWAQIPQSLSYQGLITDASGNPVSGSHTIQFNFYTSSGAGFNTAQSRTVIGVNVFQGLFTAIIGNGASNSANAPLNNLIPPMGSTQYYIGLMVDGGSELSPRIALTAVPYAFTASSLDPAYILPGSQIGAASIDNSKLAPGIDGAKITGTLNGSIVGAGINASNITVGTFNVAQLPSTANSILDLSGGPASTSSLVVPGNNTATRPATSVAGSLRYNITESVMEYFDGTEWYFLSPKVVFLKDVEPNNVDGGVVSAGNITRILNTIEGDNTVVTLSSNQFTLGPGEYLVEASAPAYAVNYHKIRLYNVTNSSVAAMGSSETNLSGGETQTRSFLLTKLIQSTSTTYSIQHSCNGTSGGSTMGFGAATHSSLDVEVYTQVKITKLRGL